MRQPYEILELSGGPALWCLRCQHTSSDLEDVARHYCSYCHTFLDNAAIEEQLAQVEGENGLCQ